MVTIESAKQTPLPERGGSYDYEFKGTSLDTKPTENVAENSLFYELDTGRFYYFTGSSWDEIPGAGGGGGSSEWETLYESGAKHVKFKQSGAIGILEVVGPLDYDDVNFAEKHWPAGVEANFSFDLPAVFSPTGSISNITISVNYYDEEKSIIGTSWTTGTAAYYFMYPLKG